MFKNRIAKMLTKVIFGLYIVALVACPGNKGDNNAAPPPPAPGTNCIPGQMICTAGIGAGGALMQGPALSSLDYQGSLMLLNFTSVNGTPVGVNGYNQGYNGPVNIVGTIRLQRPCGQFYQGGEFAVQGQGTWEAGYGGAIARVTGQLTSQAGQVLLGSSLIKFGSDSLNPQAPAQGYYLQGQVYIGACGGTFTAL